MDIEIAIEQKLITNYILKHPELINQLYSVKTHQILYGFVTVPYVIDFGVIITGTIVSMHLIIKYAYSI